MSVRCSIGSKLVTTNHYVTDYKMKLSTRKRLTELIRKMFFMTYFTFQAILPLIINDHVCSICNDFMFGKILFPQMLKMK